MLTQLSQLIVNAGGVAAIVDYVGETRGNVRLPGIMMLGYVAAHSENLSMAVIVSKVSMCMWCYLSLSLSLAGRGTYSVIASFAFSVYPLVSPDVNEYRVTICRCSTLGFNCSLVDVGTPLLPVLPGIIVHAWF